MCGWNIFLLYLNVFCAAFMSYDLDTVKNPWLNVLWRALIILCAIRAFRYYNLLNP